MSLGKPMSTADLQLQIHEYRQYVEFSLDNSEQASLDLPQVGR